MTEAVILEVIALIGLRMFFKTVISLVEKVLKATPSSFRFETKHGYVEVAFDNKADEQS